VNFRSSESLRKVRCNYSVIQGHCQRSLSRRPQFPSNDLSSVMNLARSYCDGRVMSMYRCQCQHAVLYREQSADLLCRAATNRCASGTDLHTMDQLLNNWIQSSSTASCHSLYKTVFKKRSNLVQLLSGWRNEKL
jgi:hypothetical protein